MKGIGYAMYILTLIYFGTMFGLPSIYINEECGAGVGVWIYYLYGAQGLLTGCYEVWAVKRIEKRIQKKSILSFNRWHVVELVMG